MEQRSPAKVGLDNHDEPLSIWLDLFRWTAAFAVLLAHVNHRLFIHFGDIPHHLRSPLTYLFDIPSSFGVAAVMIFFVISGFLVGGSSLRRFRKTGLFSWRDYMIARLSRLWTVLLPTLVLGGLLVWIGMIFFRAPVAESLAALQPGTFVCNVVFLQTAACDPFAADGALWSLFNEFWYYVAWPPLMIALFSKGTLRARLPLLLASIALLAVLTAWQFGGANLILYFSLWLIGVVAADRDRPFLPLGSKAAGLIFILTLAIWRVGSDSQPAGTNIGHEFPVDLILALGFANLIMTLKADTGLRFPPLLRLHRPMANFSYSLYCAHTPLINLFVLTVALVMASTFILSQLTERHTAAIRRRMERVVSSRRQLA